MGAKGHDDMQLSELGGLLFICCILYVAPSYLFYLLGGWPCVVAFIGAKGLEVIASKAMAWR